MLSHSPWDGLTLVCPVCSNRLTAVPGGEAWACSTGHRYPVVAGILDCRSSVDGLDLSADRRLAENLAERTDSFETLLRWYWRQEGIADELAERYVHGDLIGGQRAATVTDQIEELSGRPLADSMVGLEVGAGTAALSSELARRVRRVVATDVSLAWLVLARRRLAAEQLDNVALIAASGDALPFADRSFDLVVAADVIEHVADPQAFVRSSYRVLAPSGVFWLSTPNRYSLTREPHVRVWGVGFLPRKWAPRYVARKRGVDYAGIRTLSRRELQRAMASTGAPVTVTAPAIPAAVRGLYPRTARLLIDAYNRAQRTEGLRRLLLVVTPLFHAIVRKEPVRDRRTR